MLDARLDRCSHLLVLSLLVGCSTHTVEDPVERKRRKTESVERSDSRPGHGDAAHGSHAPSEASPDAAVEDHPKPESHGEAGAHAPDLETHGAAGAPAREPESHGSAGGHASSPEEMMPEHPADSGMAHDAGAAGTGGDVAGSHSHMPPAADGGGAGDAGEAEPDDDAGVEDAGPPAAGASGAGAGGSAGEAGGNVAGASGAGMGGSAGEAGGSAAGSSGASGAPAPSGDHCVDGEAPAAADATLASEPEYWVSPAGAIDLILPAGVIDWMNAREWLPSHDAWHNIRRCSGVASSPRGTAAICQRTDLVPASQQCSGPDDGLQFLAMHRHMIQSLKQAFPQHTELFDGFQRFPLEAADVPAEWQDRFGTGWSQAVLDTAIVLEDVENRLDQFPTEGHLGQYIQCGAMSRLSNIHGAMHFKWSVSGSPYSLGRQSVNLSNYMFWKLHGWIDNIWERYRVAKGLPPDEPALKAALVQQCHEMHALAEAVEPPPEPPAPGELPVEAGLFQETVRPIFEQICSSCHSETSPEAGMSLGGRISSAEVVENLVNVPAMHGGQFVRIAPGLPEQSWLYLKVSGLAAGAGCVGEACNPQTMPPTGQVTLTQAQLDAIRGWIAQGAPAPTVAE